MRAAAVLSAGTWDAAKAVDRVLLDFDHRHRRRILLRTDGGRDMLLDLPEALRLRHGDGLQLDNGGVVLVAAPPEDLLEIQAHDEGELVRIAWHLGNRHLSVQVLGARLRIRDDHVIRAMVERLGGQVATLQAPFDPEVGAYEHAHHHGDDPPH